MSQSSVYASIQCAMDINQYWGEGGEDNWQIGTSICDNHHSHLFWPFTIP